MALLSGPDCTEIARELRSLAAGGLRPVYGAGHRRGGPVQIEGSTTPAAMSPRSEQCRLTAALRGGSGQVRCAAGEARTFATGWRGRRK